MARTLPTPCTQPGCPNLVKGGGRCPQHATRHARYGELVDTLDTLRWRRLRRLVLAREPCCRMCAREGHDKLANEVDHVIPRSEGGADWDLANLQPLCHHHHTEKTMAERSRRGGA